VINELEALSKSTGGEICVAYLYIRYTEQTTLRELLEVLVKQTAERHPDCLPLIEAVYAQHFREDTEPAEGELLALLHDLVRSKRATFYILDALDEAPIEVRLRLVAKLASLGAKLLITSRPLECLEDEFPEAHFLPIVAHDYDIELHVTEKLSTWSSLRTLLRDCDSDIKQGILVAVKSKARGM
jgi:ankyrin repeat domain-containing protein 50